jgi:micrococcal nuclease
VRVIDGDTIEVEIDGEVFTLRYIGIDTPETVDPTTPQECFGAEASAANANLVLNKDAELEKDVSDTDRFGRLLRYVYVGGELVNERLVRDGYAVSSTFPPDVKHQDRFTAAEREAREAGRGLWAPCGGADRPLVQATPVPTPVPVVATQPPAPPPPPPPVAPPPTQPPVAGNCDPHYPTICVPPPPPDLNCGDIPQYARFTVLAPDPHGFDGNDNDGIGCESN